MEKEKNLDYALLVNESEDNSYEITPREFLFLEKKQGIISAMHIRSEYRGIYQKRHIFDDAQSFIKTDIEGVIIVNNSKLYDFNTGKFISKKYFIIETIGNKQFFVVDKINGYNCLMENRPIFDYLMFRIDINSKIVSSIYSELAHDFILSEKESQTVDYEEFIANRQENLCNFEKQEMDIVKILKTL